MIKRQQIENAVVEALLICLEEIPFVRVEQTTLEVPPLRPDAVVRVATPDREHLLVVEVKGNGQPRIAREAINQLLRYRDSHPGAYGVFIAPYVSPRTAELCKEEGVGFVDLAGNCRLSFGQVFIQKSGEKNPPARRRDLRSFYSPKASRVLRVLLHDPHRSWKLQDLACEADVSIGQASNVKKLLRDREWICPESGGVQLAEPAALLAEWSQSQRYRRHHKYPCYSLAPAREVEQRLAEACSAQGEQFALTGFSAALRFAPMVRAQGMAAYVTGDIDALLADLGLKPVKSGANATLIEPGDEGVFYGACDIDGLATVSPVQAYLDLVGAGGRGEEAAQAILDRVIQKQW